MAIDSDWDQKLTAGSNHIEQFQRRSVSPQVISGALNPELFIFAAHTCQYICEAVYATLTNISTNSLAENFLQIPMLNLMNDGTWAVSEDVAEPTKSSTISETKSPWLQ